jgi:hypothetical protein
VSGSDVEDDGRLDAEADPVRVLEDQLVGEQRLDVPQSLGVKVYPALERAVVVHEGAAEGRCGVEGAQLERKQRRAVLLLPERRREHRRHHEIDERLVLGDDRQILDHARELRRVLDLLPDEAGERPAAELGVGRGLRPERDQWGQAQLAPEGKLPEHGRRRRLGIGRCGGAIADDHHGPILP